MIFSGEMTGKFWLAEHAEILLHGRCQWAAGQWNQFCQRILTAGLVPKNPSIHLLKSTELAAAVRQLFHFAPIPP